MKKHSSGSFQWEKDLSDSFQKHGIPALLPRQEKSWPVAVLNESTCSDGRADLVYARLPRRILNGTFQGWANLLALPTCSRVIASLPRNAVRTEQFLSSRVGVAPSTLRRSLRKLQDAGLVLEEGQGRFSLNDRFSLPPIEIASFEFKLSNWRRALYQATRYRSFSHRVYVVLPTESSNVASMNRRLFESLNIGLITHDVTGEWKQVVRPRKREPTTRYRLIMAFGALLETRLS